MDKKNYIQPTTEIARTIAAQHLMGASNPWNTEILPGGNEIETPQY